MTRKKPTPPGLGDEYKDGATTTELCKKYKIGQPTLLRMLDELGVERRPSVPPNAFREDIPGVGEEYKNGATVNELKAKYRIHHNTLKEMLEKQGVKLRKPMRRSPISQGNAKKIKAEYKKGQISISDLATKYGHSYGAVYNMLRRDPSITMRTPGMVKEAREPIKGIEWEYATGASIAKLATDNKCGKDRIRKMLVDLGVTIRPRGPHR